MNSKIQPTYVDFNTAKLLKEKGFDLKSRYHYPNLSSKQDICLVNNWNNFTDMSGSSDYYTAPEQHQVVEWLRIEKGIWIQVSISRYGKFYCNVLKKEATKSLDNPISWEMQSQLNDFNSPQAAYSAAFDYILIKLI